MSDTVIRVENLGKKYVIGYQKEAYYRTLRDAISGGVKSFGRKLLTPFGKRMADSDVEEFWALKDVSFEVKQGERLGIIGRNGAGKSTLLKILSRITEPTTGRISIKGRVASLLEVGTGFHPELTGRENIYLNGAILGMSKGEIKRKFDEIVAFSEVETFLDTPVKRYSSGMYVRLAFAVAAHLEPEILIVDEVLAVGDAAFQKKCLGKLEDVGKQGRTVFFVSHNLQAVMRLCSTGICLENGNLSKIGDVQSVANHYFSSTTGIRQKEIDLSQERRPNFGIKSYFKILKLNLSCTNEQLVYKIGETIGFELTYQYDLFTEGLRIGLGINTMLGQRLCTFHTQASSNLIKLGLGKIYLEVDTSQFKPGTYTVDVGAGSGNVGLDSVTDVVSFEIASINSKGLPDDEDNFGLVSIKHTFSEQ